jgi:type VI secretion system protein ImpH
MDAEIRPAATALAPRRRSVEALLHEAPHRIEFFQAVRLLSRVLSHRSPVGRQSHPRDEVVRFRVHQSMASPGSEVYDLQLPGDTASPEPAVMRVSMMGLTGPLGALPYHYTQLLVDPGERGRTAALRDFLDLFNHRFISLFYRAWEKHHVAVAYEQGGDDAFSRCLLSLIGMGTPALQRRSGGSESVLLYYSGLLSQRPRSAWALQALLEDHFDVPVTVEQFTGQWFLMNPDTLTRIGTGGQHHPLGVSAALWERVWDPQARFRISVGPLTYPQFRDFLPIGDAYRRLVDLTRFCLGEEASFEVRPVLEAGAVPRHALGVDRSARLGWAAWLTTRQPREPQRQAMFLERAAHVLSEGAA